MNCDKSKSNIEPVIYDDMSVNKVFDNISGQLQVGKRQDLFWLVLSGILATVLVVTNVFGKKKRR